MKCKSSFTKKDLLVILVSVAFALANLGAIGTSTGRRRAKEFVCLSNLLRWGRIFQAFTNDNNGYFQDRDAMFEWPVTFESYYKNPKMLLCPEATKSVDEGGVNPFMAWNAEVGASDIGNRQLFWRTPHVKDASCAPILLDGQWKDADPTPWDSPPEHEGDFWPPGQDEIQRPCVNRHNGGVNGLFLDFSARKIGLKELWEIWWYRGWVQDLEVVGRPDFCTPTGDYNGWMCPFKDYYP
jgi:prepilin-type processing-associated H-X9-DG protein